MHLLEGQLVVSMSRPSSQVCYVSRYDGKDRGVLVQLGQLQLGHFPLGFFDEAMSKPPPNFL